MRFKIILNAYFYICMYFYVHTYIFMYLCSYEYVYDYLHLFLCICIYIHIWGWWVGNLSFHTLPMSGMYTLNVLYLFVSINV
jgi:hypothetical protein